MGNPKVVAKGKDAHSRAKQLLQYPSQKLVQISNGVYNFQSGVILGSKRMVVMASREILYMEGDTLYEMGSYDLARDEINIAQFKGIQSAIPTFKFVKGEIDLIMDFISQKLATVSVLEIVAFYHTNKMKCDSALRLSSRIILNLNRIRQKHSTLFIKMASSTGKNILRNIPKGVTAKEVGNFIFECIKNISDLPETTFRPIMLCVSQLTSKLLLSIALKTTSHESNRILADLRTILRNSGIIINEQEALQISKDIKADPKIEKTLKELEMDIQKLVPILNTLKGIKKRW